MWKDKAQGALTLSFDDGFKETIDNVLPLLEKYKFVASFNFIIGLLGKKFLGLKLASYSDLKRTANQGMEIASHSLKHIDLSRGDKFRKYLKSLPHKHNKIRYLLKGLANPDRLKKKNDNSNVSINLHREIVESKNELVKKGFEVTSFVYPGGWYDNQIKQLVAKHYLSARTADAGLNSFNLKDFYGLKTFVWDKWTTLETANEWIDKTIKERGWLIETFHLVSSTNQTDYEYFTPISEFEEHIKYLKTKNIWVGTQAEIIKFIIGNKRNITTTRTKK